MPKDLNISYLLDFYGQMLTPKQLEVTELYYNADLSLAEIAADSGITRQGVRDSIKRAEIQLTEYEARLGLAKKFVAIQKGLDNIIRNSQEIAIFNDKYFGSADIEKRVKAICELAENLNN